jgi:ubiquinone/menaquinone biosynthesis C-methylase UbiE
MNKIRFTLAYLVNPRWDTGISPPELISIINKYPCGRALDLGCGTGTNLLTLAQHGWQVSGIDFAPTALRLARKKLARANIQAELRLGDVSNLDVFRDNFDLILDIGCLHSINAEKRLLTYKQIQRKLLSDGTFLMYSFIKSSENDRQPGITVTDIDYLSDILVMVQRVDGFDIHGHRHSTWLTFRTHK